MKKKELLERIEKLESDVIYAKEFANLYLKKYENIKSKFLEEKPQEETTTFKVGDFFKTKESDIRLITEFKGDKVLYDGFYLGKYKSDYVDLQFLNKHCKLATTDQILSHLIKVAELKGYKEGVEVVNCYGNNMIIDDSKHYLNYRYFEYGGAFIFDMQLNKWAEIVEEPEETLTYSIHADGKEIGKLSVSEYKELCDYINEMNKGVKK